MKFYIVLFLVLLLNSCSSTHFISLYSVESPLSKEQQSTNNTIINFKKDKLNHYNYEDDNINIIWNISSTEFNFVLKNKTEHSIKINWDEVSYIDINGRAGRIMHSGVKYSERNNSQVATIIPKNSYISDCILPTDNVYLSPGKYGGWQERDLINFSKDKIGKKMYLYIPLIIGDIKNDYTFEFRIEKIIEKKNENINNNSYSDWHP